jgi:hypothetical protein
MDGVMLYAAGMTVSVAIEPGAIGPVNVVVDNVHSDARRPAKHFRHTAANDDGYAGDSTLPRSQTVGRRAGQGSHPPEFSESTYRKQQ